MKTPGEQFNAAVGRQLRAEIGAAGSSVAAMAREIGIARSALDNYVTGKRAIPVPIVYAVGDVVDVEPHLILRRAEERLAAEDGRRTATITELPRRTDVRGHREDESEVAFDSSLSHARDTDDLYD
ncbi:helix-turn-helix domain-containing protein [Microbacterium hydrocarbonoxydans]|uniref:helix-turn-helix domain-containing protein n=1 Tax=Microbacterium hydrocarbonoxydans TaxID=273678 RepID=UPI001FDEC404|nr:helix-turn-helix transcriptional regulator [Microbacterium hydrocarbonoxydans]